jgi:hypothetical protein
MVSVAASVHQCRSVGLPVHDRRDGLFDLHPTFGCCFSSSPVTSIHSLSPNGWVVGGIPFEMEIRWLRQTGPLAFCYGGCSVVVAEGSEMWGC